ncbi:MAG: transporter suffix domain-containing protein [Simkaniaceae bacterium]|nr:MAG: transporter suffix domain-containing protein [Simkaniaceae bacterium]
MKPLKKDWKYYLGMTFLILSFLIPAIGFIFPFLGLPTALAAALLGVFTVGIPEVMILLAVLLLGKETFNYYKNKIFKRKYPPKPVSKFRYYFGLVIFLASPIPLYMNGYSPDLLPEGGRHYILIAGDLAFVLSFFILGGGFWEKIKALFRWESR